VLHWSRWGGERALNGAVKKNEKENENRKCIVLSLFSSRSFSWEGGILIKA